MGERPVDDQSDHDHVGEGSQTRPLPERNPEEHHRGADHDDPGADRQRSVTRQSLMEDVPGIEAETGEYQEPIAEAVQHEAGGQLEEAAWQAIPSLWEEPVEEKVKGHRRFYGPGDILPPRPGRVPLAY